MADLMADAYDAEAMTMHNLVAAEEEEPRACLCVMTDADGVMHVYLEPTTEGQTWRLWNTEVGGVRKAEIRFDPVG